MPAPQVVVVQLHSNWSIGLPEASYCGAVHAGTPVASLAVGKGLAVACSNCLACCEVIPGCADIMSARVPVTSGAEKLVPSEALKLSV